MILEHLIEIGIFKLYNALIWELLTAGKYKLKPEY